MTSRKDICDSVLPLGFQRLCLFLYCVSVPLPAFCFLPLFPASYSSSCISPSPSFLSFFSFLFFSVPISFFLFSYPLILSYFLLFSFIFLSFSFRLCLFLLVIASLPHSLIQLVLMPISYLVLLLPLFGLSSIKSLRDMIASVKANQQPILMQHSSISNTT